MRTYRRVCDAHAPHPNPIFTTIPREKFLGMFVQLAFRNKGKTEYCWVHTFELGQELELRGELNNDIVTPEIAEIWSCGDWLEFNRDEILQIMDP